MNGETGPAAVRKPWIRWVAGIFLVLAFAVVVVEVIIVWPNIQKSWEARDTIRLEWVLACIVAAGLSMFSYAQVQRALLNSAGVSVTRWQSLSVILAGNSISQTMPGGSVIAPAFTYRATRRWGATSVIASWQLVMSGLLAGVGLAILGLAGALIAGAKTNPFSIFFSIAGFIAFAVIAQFVATHPESIRGLGLKVLSWTNALRNKPDNHGHERWGAILEQLRAVQLNAKDTAYAFGWSLFNWVADVFCLACACYAANSHPSIAGLMVAYATAKAAGIVLPLLPGGLGVVDTVLTTALITAGIAAPQALISIIIYRIISTLLVVLIGWIIITVMFRDELKTSRTDNLEELG